MEIFCIEEFQITYGDISLSWRWDCVVNSFQRVQGGKVVQGRRAIKGTVAPLTKSWNHKRILRKDGKCEESTGFNYSAIHIYNSIMYVYVFCIRWLGNFYFRLLSKCLGQPLSSP